LPLLQLKEREKMEKKMTEGGVERDTKAQVQEYVFKFA